MMEHCDIANDFEYGWLTPAIAVVLTVSNPRFLTFEAKPCKTKPKTKDL